MENNYFKVLRGGTHTTFQDNGFFNKQHLGITIGGAIDNELFLLSNKALNNDLNTAVMEFCFQGPVLELINGLARILITGNVLFKITTFNRTIIGIPYKSYFLKKGDIIDIISTIDSNYGYMSIEGGFKIKSIFDSFSTLTTAKIGSNEGNKISENQKLFFRKKGSNREYNFKYLNKKNVTNIRVIPGPQMNYFFPKIIKNFYNKEFKISNNSNRIGVRLENNICKAVKSHNINSEGLIRGSIQVPGDGNPIVLLNDHPTIGGYPKIGIVILTDLARIAQLPIGSKFKFEKISLTKAEEIYKKNIKNLNKILKFKNK